MRDVPIGIVINADTRIGWDNDSSKCGMGMGCRSIDFMTDSVLNKINFFRGYDVDVTLYVDVHCELSQEAISRIMALFEQRKIHNLVFNRHMNRFMGYPIRQLQCTMYLNALTMSRGHYIAHFDADAGAFRRDECDIIERWMNWIDSGKYKYISYGCDDSPNPCQPDGYDYYWPSTRFFFCRRDQIDYDSIRHCFNDSIWLQAHGARKYRYPNCMEQILGFLAGPGAIYYPPKDFEQYMVFTWHTYYNGTVAKLDSMPYDEVYRHIMEECGGIGGPCDAHAVESLVKGVS
jgi:hypothetical protein